MRRSGYFICCMAALLLNGPPLAAAVVSMQTGERLIGEISSQSDSAYLVLESPLLGELTLPRDQIASIEKEPPSEAPEVAAESSSEVSGSESGAAGAPPSALAGTEAPAPGWLERARDFKAPEDWTGNLRLGINLSSGDSKWTETFMKANLVVDPPEAPHFFRYGGSYTLRETEKNDGSTVVSTDRADANFTYRRDVSESWFLQNSLGGRVDRVKGIDRELQELVGLGYRLTPSERLEFLVGGGGGVEDFQTDAVDTRAGIHPVANFFQEFTWRPFEKASLVQEFNYFVNPRDAQQYNYLIRAAFRYRITDLFGVEFSFDKNFDNDVGNGNARDDTRLRNAVIVYF